jgi:hypothetical protein
MFTDIGIALGRIVSLGSMQIQPPIFQWVSLM